MPPLPTTKKEYGIRLAPGVAAQIDADVTAWAAPFLCESVVRAELLPEDRCIHAAKLHAELHRIVQDEKIDRLEAPPLFHTVATLAGPDRTLDAAEAGALTLLLTFGTMRTASSAPADQANAPASPTTLIVDSPLVTPIQNLLHPFAIDHDATAAVFVHLQETRGELDRVLRAAEAAYADSRAEAQSFFSFMSAENMLGLSAQCTYDGAPFSDGELQGRQEFLARLREIKSGLDAFTAGVRAGYLLEDAPNVQTFLQSPFGTLAHLADHLTAQEVDESTAETTLRWKLYHAGVIALAEHSGATRAAAAMRRDLSATYPEFRVEDYYRAESSDLFRWLDTSFTEFANVAVSFDSLALLCGGGLLGKMLASIPRVRTTVAALRATKIARRVRPFLPGVPLITTTARTFVGRSATLLVNFGYEIFKVNLYGIGGYLVDGREGALWGARLYLLALGVTTAYGTAIDTNLAAELLSGNPGALAHELLDRGYSAADITTALQDASRAVSVRSFRLAPTIRPTELAQRLLRMRSAIANLTRTRAALASVDGQITAELGALRTLIENETQWANRAWSARAEAIITGTTDKNEALKNLRIFISDCREEVGRLKRVARVRASDVVSRRAPKRVRTEPDGGSSAPEGDAGAKPNGAAADESSTTHVDSDEPAPRASHGATPLSDRPPAALDRATFDTVAQQKVTCRNGAWNDLQEFYRDNPKLRSTILRRIEEMRQSPATLARLKKEWKWLKVEQVWRGRIGGYRLLSTYDTDTGVLTITRIIDRGHMKVIRRPR